MNDFLIRWLDASLMVLLESSPWLIFGLLAAGILDSIGVEKFISRRMSRPGWRSVVWASALGIPLPLCSCSVIPVGISLKRKGASAGATASFFISTPQIGVDSFLLTWGLMGPLFAGARVAASFISAMAAGLAIDLSPETGGTAPIDEVKSCCSSAADVSEGRLRRILHFGFVEMVDDLALVLTSGILIAGLAAALVPETLFQEGALHPMLTAALMLLISIPVYVCATSSTPFAAVLVAKGISPGAALVFLLAGPATNVSSILALKRDLGMRALLIYLASIVLVAIAAAVLIDSGFINFPAVDAAALAQHAEKHTWLQWVSGGVLSLLLMKSLIRTYTHRST